MNTVALAQKLVNKNSTLFWFRRDLRLEDNAGLYHALLRETEVIPLFIFDTEILNDLDDKEDARISFIHESLTVLKQQFEHLKSSLLVLYGNPVELFAKLNPKAVYANHDYEPYARKRDEAVRKILQAKGTSFYTFKDQVIFDKDEVTKDSGDPYTVFTPYSRKWKSKLNKFFIKSYPTEKYSARLKKLEPLSFPAIEEIGFKRTSISLPARIIKSSIISAYDTQRNFPASKGTSRLGVHLRFGTVSIRNLVQIALKKNETWLNELIWREFYQMILWHFPDVENHAFKPAYDRIAWRNNQEEFQA